MERPAPQRPTGFRRPSTRTALSAIAVAALVTASLIFPKSFAADAADAAPTSKRIVAKPAGLESNPVAAVGCSARGCHGRAEPRPEGVCSLNEHALWLYRDPHSTAFDVLKSERSRRIVRALPGWEARGKVEAHTDARCLACHDTPSTTSADAIVWSNSGVSCASCHTDPSRWVAGHVDIPDTEPGRTVGRNTVGLPNLRDPLTCAKTCAGCHVGAPEDGSLPRREVDHDLIAAGHPRLHFDLPTFLDAMPPHWNGPGPSKDRLAAWAAGQVAANDAWLALLQDRAKHAERPTSDDADLRAWPELTETDCFACHHGLAPRSVRPPGGRARWGNPYAALLPEALAALGVPASERAAATDAVSQVRDLMTSFAPPADDVSRSAAAALAIPRPSPAARADARADAAAVRTLLAERFRTPEAGAAIDWTTATQIYFLAAALAPDAPATEALLDVLRLRRSEGGRTPQLFDSPEHFRPDGEEFRRALDAALTTITEAPVR